MNTSIPHFEHWVTKKSEGGYRFRRSLAILLYILCPILLFLVLLSLIGPAVVIWYVPILPSLLLYVIRRVNKRFFSIDYLYVIAKGRFTVSERRDGTVTQVLFDEPVATLLAVGRVERGSPLPAADRVIMAASSKDSPQLYYAMARDKERSTLLLFDATEPMLSFLRRYHAPFTEGSTR